MLLQKSEKALQPFLQSVPVGGSVATEGTVAIEAEPGKARTRARLFSYTPRFRGKGYRAFVV